MLVTGIASEIRAFTRGHRAAGRTVAFVPTMGALHAGHVALIDRAAAESDVVILSIFVNPMQFNVAADFDRYPRTVEDDLTVARDAGVAAVYLPTADTMYPEGFDTVVHVDRTAAPLEGTGRPGHFDGVATVVTKLFAAVEPDVAIFGQKDFQQLAVVRRMTSDLDLGVRIVGAETVREEDGLALSSRNVRLTVDARRAAPVIKRALDSAAEMITNGETPDSARACFVRTLATEPAARLEYVSVADITTLVETTVVSGPVVISCAVWFDDVRLIDNVVVPE